MAEVRRIPQWIMLEALRNNVSGMHLEKSDETSTEVTPFVVSVFEIDTTGGDPVLKMLIEQTLEVGAGDTIVAILLYIDGMNAPAAYGPDDDEIRCPIGDVDGETFPDGGSIDTTDFEVYLNDL